MLFEIAFRVDNFNIVCFFVMTSILKLRQGNKLIILVHCYKQWI